MPVFMGYDPNFLAYTYEITSENNVVVADPNPEFNDQYGDIHSIIRRTPDTFEATMTVNIYDLPARQWVPVVLRAVYTKL